MDNNLSLFVMEIDWTKVKRVLVVRLRSIGDTVLSTPSLIALRRFLPEVQIDILLEDWVAPVLENFDAIDNVLTVSRQSTKSRIATALQIRRSKYDVAFNLHGGTTATFFVRASGAKHRVGYAEYQYNFLYNHLLSSASDFWQQKHTHSAEQQLALLGFVGIPVEDKPKTHLVVNNRTNFKFQIPNSKFALIHPVAAFDTKQWATENFVRVAEYLHEKGLAVVAIATPKEREVLEKLKQLSNVPIVTLDNLTLPEITALASRAEIFIGNDSGIAHIAAAVETSSVVIFGSSNINHWRPWTNGKAEIVYKPMPCQPCAGYSCREFDEPKCILGVEVEQVIRKVERLLAA